MLKKGVKVRLTLNYGISSKSIQSVSKFLSKLHAPNYLYCSSDIFGLLDCASPKKQLHILNNSSCFTTCINSNSKKCV